MSRRKKMSRKEELLTVTTTVGQMISFFSEKHHISIAETFVMMNTLYANLLDEISRMKPDKVSEEDMKAYMKEKVGLLLDVIDEEIPVNLDNDEQTK